MKTKALILESCLGCRRVSVTSNGYAGKKFSASKSKRMAPKTALVTRNVRSNQNVSPRTGSTRYYSGSRYSDTGFYVGQYSTRYYGPTGYNGSNYYGGGTRCDHGGGSYPYYGYYSGWPYSNWGYGTSWGYYSYSYGGGLSVQWSQQLLLVLHANIRL